MPASNTAHVTPVDALWGWLAQTFGGDALSRRLGDTPPQAWRDVVNGLHPREIERGMRRLLHSGRAYVPTLPEFLKLAKAVGDDAEPLKPETPFAQIEGPKLDAWASTGNQHLLAEIYRHPRRFGGPDNGRITAILVAAKNRWVETMRDTDPEDREDGGKAVWDSLMRQAWSEIDRRQREVA